jgi:hypothetical protein
MKNKRGIFISEIGDFVFFCWDFFSFDKNPYIKITALCCLLVLCLVGQVYTISPRENGGKTETTFTYAYCAFDLYTDGVHKLKGIANVYCHTMKNFLTIKSNSLFFDHVWFPKRLQPIGLGFFPQTEHPK